MLISIQMELFFITICDVTFMLYTHWCIPFFGNLEALAPVSQQQLKSDLKKKCKNVSEWIAKEGNPTLLNQIFTELYITEGGS